MARQSSNAATQSWSTTLLDFPLSPYLTVMAPFMVFNCPGEICARVSIRQRFHAESCEEGSASLNAFAMLLFVVMVCSAIAAMTSSLSFSFAKSNSVKEKKAELLTKIAEISEALAKKKYNGFAGFESFRTSFGADYRLRELGSRLNPLWLRKQFWQRSSLSGIFKPGSTADQLQQYLEDQSFSLPLSGDLNDGRSDYLSAFFEKEDIQKLMSVWPPLSINCCDEFALERIAFSVTKDAAFAANLRSKYRSYLSAQKQVTQEDLLQLLAPYADILAEKITANAAFDVNTVESKILEAVLSYPAFEIANATSLRESLLSIRKNRWIKTEELPALLGKPAEHSVFAWLGAQLDRPVNRWELIVQQNSLVATAVLDGDGQLLSLIWGKND